MSSAFKVVTPPTTEPITLSDAKSYLRVDFTDDDTVISNLITRARALCEAITHRALATQQLQQIVTIDRPIGGALSGPITPGYNWYQYNEQLGANPFGPSAYYFDLGMPPLHSELSIVVRTQVTVFDTWQIFTGNYVIDSVQEPGRVYFQDPVTANRWQFNYTAGYDGVTYFMPPDLLQALYECVGYLYDYREAQDFPEALKAKLLIHRVDWI